MSEKNGSFDLLWALIMHDVGMWLDPDTGWKDVFAQKRKFNLYYQFQDLIIGLGGTDVVGAINSIIFHIDRQFVKSQQRFLK